MVETQQPGHKDSAQEFSEVSKRTIECVEMLKETVKNIVVPASAKEEGEKFIDGIIDYSGDLRQYC